MFSTVFPRFGLSNNFAHRTVLLTANPKPFDSQATRVWKSQPLFFVSSIFSNPRFLAKRLHGQPIVEKNLLRNSCKILILPKSSSIFIEWCGKVMTLVRSQPSCAEGVWMVWWLTFFSHHKSTTFETALLPGKTTLLPDQNGFFPDRPRLEKFMLPNNDVYCLHFVCK